MPILGDFAVKYAAQAQELGVPTDDLYQALVDTAENTVYVHLYDKYSLLIYTSSASRLVHGNVNFLTLHVMSTTDTSLLCSQLAVRIRHGRYSVIYLRTGLTPLAQRVYRQEKRPVLRK